MVGRLRQRTYLQHQGPSKKGVQTSLIGDHIAAVILPGKQSGRPRGSAGVNRPDGLQVDPLPDIYQEGHKWGDWKYGCGEGVRITLLQRTPQAGLKTSI